MPIVFPFQHTPIVQRVRTIAVLRLSDDGADADITADRKDVEEAGVNFDGGGKRAGCVEVSKGEVGDHSAEVGRLVKVGLAGGGGWGDGRQMVWIVELNFC